MFLKWTLPSLNLVRPIFPKGVSVKDQSRMANSVDPDETTHCEPSHQDLYTVCIKLVLFCRAETVNYKISTSPFRYLLVFLKPQDE